MSVQINPPVVVKVGVGTSSDNNSYKIRKRRDDLNLTRIMINKVSHNESYKSSYYRNINSHFRKNRDNDNRYKRNNSYNKKFVPNFKK